VYLWSCRMTWDVFADSLLTDLYTYVVSLDALIIADWSLIDIDVGV